MTDATVEIMFDGVAVRAVGASTVTCINVVTSIGGTGTGFIVSKGAVIAANGSTGSLSQTANTLTADGIIYK